jgi:hypothetical protein
MRVRPALIAASAAGAAALLALLLFLLVPRDTGVELAVPGEEMAAFRGALGGLSLQPGHPTVRLRPLPPEERGILEGKRPGLAVVSMAPWVAAAIADGRLRTLPASAFPAGLPPLPAAFLSATDPRPGTTAALPLAFDPWMAAWHRDLIGGPRPAPPRDWTALIGLALEWRKRGASALALAGREPDAELAMLAILGTARGPGASAEALKLFPGQGRETVADALRRLASLQRAGLLQPGSASSSWSDALDLVRARKAAGALIPISRLRSLSEADAAPLVVVRVPDFPGAAGYGLLADVRVLVMPARGGRGTEKVAAWLAGAES